MTAPRRSNHRSEELISDLDGRIEKQLAQRRRRIEERARGSGGGPARIGETQARLGEAIVSLGERIEALERERRARQGRGRRPLLRLSEVRKIVRQARRLRRAETVDDFGLDLDFYDTMRPFLEFLYERYFRVEAEGAAELVPREGPVILVANRGGPFCYDGLMTAEAVARAHPGRRVRFLLDDVLSASPGIGPLLVRIGGIRAARENARRLLERGEAVLFPLELARPGRARAGGDSRGAEKAGAPPVPEFASLASRLRLPVIPVAILGADEAQPVIGHLPALAGLLRMPEFPITATGLIPLPVKFRIRFGDPIAPAAPRGRKSAGSAAAALHDRARARIVAMHHDLRAARKSILLG